jgi:hypothetical protein
VSTTSSTQTLGAPRGRLAGLLLIGMLGASIAHTLIPEVPRVLAALLAWAAFAVLWPRFGTQQRAQIVVLIALGLVGVWWGHMRGVAVDVERLLGQNQLIISLLASVTLLRMLKGPLLESEPELPRGIGTYVRSMFGVHAFAAVINISALVIMADRLSRFAALQINQAQLLSRAFTMAAFYSPFIAGVALALAYTPGSSWPLLLSFGMPLTLIGFITLYLYARLGKVADIDNFRGYPVHFESLWLPVSLGVAVLVLHAFTPEYSVLALVTMLAPVIVIGTLTLRGGIGHARSRLGEYVDERLPELAGELALFLSAGVLASGLVAVFATTGGWVPFERLDAQTASALLIVMLAVSLIGVHPVIVVSAAAPLLAPIDPDPNLLAMVFAMGWGIGCAVNPLSGTILALHGRYGINNWVLARSNFAFGATLCIFAIGLLHTYAWFWL